MELRIHDKNNNKRLLILIIFLRKVDFPFLVTTLGEETFRERKFCEVKNFRDKFSKMSSNDAFHENLTFANDYFKRQNLIKLAFEFHFAWDKLS